MLVFFGGELAPVVGKIRSWLYELLWQMNPFPGKECALSLLLPSKKPETFILLRNVLHVRSAGKVGFQAGCHISWPASFHVPSSDCLKFDPNSYIIRNSDTHCSFKRQLKSHLIKKRFLSVNIKWVLFPDLQKNIRVVIFRISVMCLWVSAVVFVVHVFMHVYERMLFLHNYVCFYVRVLWDSLCRLPPPIGSVCVCVCVCVCLSFSVCLSVCTWVCVQRIVQCS